MKLEKVIESKKIESKKVYATFDRAFVYLPVFQEESYLLLEAVGKGAWSFLFHLMHKNYKGHEGFVVMNSELGYKNLYENHHLHST